MNVYYFCMVYKGMKRVRSLGLKICLLFAALTFTFSACQKDSFNEVPLDTNSTLTSISHFAEILSTFDILEDLATSHDLMLKKNEILLPEGVLVVIVDNNFDDGDGIEVELQFGEPTGSPAGILCKDGRYRAGKLILELDKPYSEKDASLTVSMPESSPFYSGSGTSLNEMTGQLIFKRSELHTVHIKSKKLSVKESGGSPVAIDLDLTCHKIHESGLGIYQ